MSMGEFFAVRGVHLPEMVDTVKLDRDAVALREEYYREIKRGLIRAPTRRELSSRAP